MVPQDVIDHVKRQIGTLHILTRARQTDRAFNGLGRYEAESYVSHQGELDLAWQRLAEFKRLCEKNGVDPATVYAQTGEPPQLSRNAKDWLE